MGFSEGRHESVRNSNRCYLARVARRNQLAKLSYHQQCDEKIEIVFDEAMRQLTGYQQQEITMFTGEFLGIPTDLHPQDEEIDDICFVPPEKVIEYLSHDESRKFFQKLFSC